MPQKQTKKEEKIFKVLSINAFCSIVTFFCIYSAVDCAFPLWGEKNIQRPALLMLYLYSTKQVSPAAPRASPVRTHCGAGLQPWLGSNPGPVRAPLPPERKNLCDIQYVLYGVQCTFCDRPTSIVKHLFSSFDGDSLLSGLETTQSRALITTTVCNKANKRLLVALSIVGHR